MRLRIGILALFSASLAAQVPAPQLNLTGNIGCQGFPCLNSGTLVMSSDANRTMTVQESSAFYIKVTSAVSLTATRNLVFPSGRFGVTVENATTGGQAIQVIGASGTGVTIPNGQTVAVWNDGTNFVQVGANQVYPGSGIPNSTGTAWGTSYGTSGTGSVALTASPTFTGTVSFATLSQPSTSSTWNSTGLFLYGAFQWYPAGSTHNFIFAGSPTISRNISYPDASGTVSLVVGTLDYSGNQSQVVGANLGIVNTFTITGTTSTSAVFVSWSTASPNTIAQLNLQTVVSSNQVILETYNPTSSSITIPADAILHLKVIN